MYQNTLSLLDAQNKGTKVISCRSVTNDQQITEDETWIEVTNKSNQTPSHWVYDDMITKDKVKLKEFIIKIRIFTI